MAFLKAEWKILTYFAVIAALLLGVMGATNPESHWSIAVAFIVGAVFSATAGYIGMNIATKANVRTAQAARTSLSKALARFLYRRLCDGPWRCRSGGAGPRLHLHHSLEGICAFAGRQRL